MSRMPKVGEMIDEVFRVEAKLDSGNFGSVYRVWDTVENRPLALKVLRPGPHDEQELIRRFEREARLIYRLQHAHVVRVLYYGETQSGLPYMAMEFLEGMHLRKLLDDHGPLPEPLARRIAVETLMALHAAHELNIVHRDLKPANIYLVNDGHKGHVKVLDFGFAKVADEAESRAELTNAQTLVGTPAYMAPELVHKKDVGPAADLYALGLILAEMVHGKKIVDIEGVYDTILFQASKKPIKLPRDVSRNIFGSVIKKAIEKKLDRRYSSASEMLAELNALPLPPGNDSALAHAGLAGSQLDTNQSTTVPRALGMPSIEEVDRALGITGQPNTRERVRDPDPRRAPRNTGRHTGHHTGRHTGPQQPVDSQQYITAHSAHPAQTGPHTRTERAPRPVPETMAMSAIDGELDLSRERTGMYAEPKRSDTVQIIIGLAIGGLVLGALVLALMLATQG